MNVESDADTEPLRRASENAYAGHPGLPEFSYRAIGEDKRLWHGRNPLTAWDVELLRREGITHILDLREPIEFQSRTRLGAEAVRVLSRPESEISRYNIAVTDGGTPSRDAFGEGVAWLERVLADPESRVYVHCRLGRERTGAILAAYHATKYSLTAFEALTQLNDQGAVLKPTPPQTAAVQAWLDSRR